MTNYLKNEKVVFLLRNSQPYQKIGLTGLRKPLPSELGKEMITYVIKEGALRVESVNTISENSVVVRNPGIIGQIDGQDIHNEWIVSQEIAIDNYGEVVVSSLTENLTYHKKQKTIKALELTPEIMRILEVSGPVLQLSIPDSTSTMEAHIGDFLTDSGCSISAHDMKNTYERASVHNSKNHFSC